MYKKIKNAKDKNEVELNFMFRQGEDADDKTNSLEYI